MRSDSSPSSAGAFPQGTGSLAGLVAAIILTLFTLSAALVPIRSDNDCWWHVKTGQYIVEHGLPKYDVFSYTAADHEWHNHEWLAQVLLYKAWAVGDATGFGGWRAAILFNGIIIWVTVMLAFLLAAKLSRNWWVALLVGILVVAIGRRMFYVRPPVMTNLLLISQIWLLVAVAEGWIRRRWLLLMVPGIALWTNVHGGWMAAGVIYGAFGIDQLISRFRERLPRLPFTPLGNTIEPRMLIGLGALLLLATLANPYGYRLYELPVRVMGDRHLVSQIGELASPNFHFVIDFELAFLAVFTLAMLVRFRPRLWELLIYLFFLHQAIQHVRHLSLFSIMMVPLTARVAGEALQAARQSLEEWRGPAWSRMLPRYVAPAVCILALFTAGWVWINPREGGSIRNITSPATYPGRNLQYFSGMGYDRGRFPSAVADFIELARLEGRMWNENHYAGYLIWRLVPEQHLVFSDSRFDIFGGDIMRKEQAISLGRIDLLDEYDVQWLITRTTRALSLILEDAAPWKLAARWPDGWEVWIRATPENEEMFARARATAPIAGAMAP